MIEVELLEYVKSVIGVTGDYQNTTIQGYIEDIKQYLLDGGVKQEIVNASTSKGVIGRGVNDLWFEGELSTYFKDRAIQLACKKVLNNGDI